MLLEYEKDFDSITETYGGFPLKKDFLAAGNAALEKYGVRAKLEDGLIRIPVFEKNRFTEEEMEEVFPADVFDPPEKPEDWRVRVDACILLSENPAEGVKDSWYDYKYLSPYRIEDDEDEYECEEEELDLAIKLAETFLNAAVDCD